MRSVPPAEAAAAFHGGAAFIDVRTSAQHARDGLPGSQCLPLDAIQSGRVPTDVRLDEPVYVVCDRGHVSELAALYLEDAGFHDVANVRGGLLSLRPLL